MGKKSTETVGRKRSLDFLGSPNLDHSPNTGAYIRYQRLKAENLKNAAIDARDSSASERAICARLEY